MTTIAILGSGVMGSALSIPLADNGHDIRLVGTHLDRDIIDSVRASGVHPGLNRALPEQVVPYQLEAEAAFDGAEVVVSGVNSFGVRWAGQQLASLVKPDMLVLAIAKGIDTDQNGELRILPDVLAEQVPDDLRASIPWSAVASPSIAGEVAGPPRLLCGLHRPRHQPGRSQRPGRPPGRDWPAFLRGQGSGWAASP
jgi:glycerol-3-phosphate dehydrogenase (NAD(P)+)